MMKNNGRIDVSWGGGESSLFLDLTGKEPRLLDYEYDNQELHERCGGKHYYESRSGNSGAGWLKNLGALLPVGYYRVDTRYNNQQSLVSLGKAQRAWYTEDVQVLVPFVSHWDEQEKFSALREYPTVIKVGGDQDSMPEALVYCQFDDIAGVLKDIFLNNDFQDEVQVGRRHYPVYQALGKSFTENCNGVAEEEMLLVHFNNLSPWLKRPNPWEFCQENLARFQMNWGNQERLYQLLSIERLGGDTFVRTMKIADRYYRGRVLEGNPLESEKLPAGWQRLADDALVRFYDERNEAHLVIYASAKAAYEKLARRFAHHMGEGEEFISFVSTYDGEYIEFELTVPKALFLLDQPAQLTELRRGLARKVRGDVMNRVRRWMNDVSDQDILEAIPDDLVITIEDSLEAGNCRPGTQEFVDQNFPGQTQTTAQELKKFSDNYDVMRIFRYLAETGQFSCHKSA